ncbi:MAG: flavin reductase family protein [Bacteroidota bacterium]|nr:flavin reductase family protein [Bacteroidota bacterium]
MQSIDNLYLEATHMLIEPGPVVLVTTHYRGKSNIMTLSSLIMLQQNPPFLLGLVLGPWNYSYKALYKTRECVISIPTQEMASTVVNIGNCSGEDEDKFSKFNLTPLPALKVGAPLIAECFANIECKVTDNTLVGKYSFFILQSVNVWTDPEHKERRTLHHNGDGTFVIDGEILDLKDKMVKWPEYL